MRTLYRVYLDGDMGELWLEYGSEFSNSPAKLQPLEWVCANDASWSDYHDFIFDSLGADLVKISIEPSDKQCDEFYENVGDAEAIFEIFKEDINNAITGS